MSLNNNENENLFNDQNINEEKKEEEKNSENINSNIEQNSQNNNNDDIKDNNDLNKNNLINDENINIIENKENELSTENNDKSQEDHNEINNNKNNTNTNPEDTQNQNTIEIPPDQYMTSIDIVKRNFCMYDLDNSFAVFTAKNGQLYLIYPLLKSFICYDLIDEEIVTTIKNAHEFYVLNFRYIYDSFSNRDLVQTISGEDNNLKLWNIENWECLVNINANSYGIMFSSCFLYDVLSQQNLLVSSNCTGTNYIQIFDFKGKKIKDVPYHEEKKKSIDSDDFNPNDNNENDDENNNDNNNIDNEDNDHDFIDNEQNIENNNSENIIDNNSDHNNNSINDGEKSNNSNKEVEQDDMNHHEFNNDKDDIIKVYDNNFYLLKNFNDEEKDNTKFKENKINKEEKESEIEEDNINNLNEESNNFIYKCYPEDDKDNLINNNIKNSQEIKNEYNEIKSNLNHSEEEIQKDEKNKNDNFKEQSEDFKIEDFNNEQIISSHIDSNYDLKMNDINEKKIDTKENNINKSNNDSINSEKNEINNNDENQENEINTNNNENNEDNMEKDHNPENNNNSNKSNNDNSKDMDNIMENLYEVKIDHIYYIDTYFDKKLKTSYIISCCSGFIKCFNYNTNTLYQIYFDKEGEKNIHGNDIVDDSNENLVRLIETCNDGYVRIWDFHLGEMLNKIKICDEGIKSICLWDENTIFVGCDDATIKMVNINTNEILHVLYGHKQRVCCLKIIEHEHFGKCIISKGWGGDFIKLWKKK